MLISQSVSNATLQAFCYILSYDGQYVSYTASSLPYILINTMYSKWVILLFFAMHSHPLQKVSDGDPFFCQAVSSHLIPWPTGSQWQCPFSVRQFHHIQSHDKQLVSDSALFYACSLSLISWPKEVSDSLSALFYCKAVSPQLILLTTAHPITNSLCVTMPFSLPVSLHLIPWFTVCEWQCPIFCQAVSLHLISWLTVCEW